MLKLIESLVKAGFAIHWLHPKSKRPIGDDWSEKPVRSFETLSKTYKEGRNVGVRLGKWSKVEDLYLHVIDMDIRVTEKAKAAIAKLTELFPEWASYPVVQSGSMGASRHFYILSDKPFPSKKLAHSGEKIMDDEGKEHWTWEIELFGTGKQVAMPPSIHPDTGKEYIWLSKFDIRDVNLGLGPVVESSHLEDLIGAEEEEDLADDDERKRPLGLTLDEARNAVWKLPIDDWCHDRDGWLNVGMALHHEFKGSKEAFGLWCEYAKQSNKFDKGDQWRVWKSFKTRGRPLRMASLISVIRDIELETEFEDLGDDFDDDENEFDDLGEERGPYDHLIDGGEPAPKKKVSKREEKLNREQVDVDLGKAVPKKVARLNKQHAVAFVNGKTIIITEKEDGETVYGNVDDLHKWYENDRVPGDKTTEPVSKMWMRSKQRRQYKNGIVFAPGGAGDGYYNHWRGFSVEPDATQSCRLIIWHLKNVICDGNEEAYQYALGWFAHMIQRPWEKPGVAMVLRGKKRTGKDTIGDYIGGLFPHHHVKVSNQDHMTGKFNAHQEKCLLLHVEEGFWAGNKSADGVLKSLITSEKVLIEPKMVNPFTVDSVLRLFMSSNEAWVVPATADEGRYFVLDVSESKRNDHVYFAAIRHEMNNGGREALLAYLQNVDLSDFQVRKVPNTIALAKQKVQGLKNVERWWFMMLESGEMEYEVNSFLRKGKLGNWPTEFVIADHQEVRDSYEKWMRMRRFEGETLDKFELGRRINLMLPSLKMSRPRQDGKQVPHFMFPDLNQCRAEFETYIGSQMLWHRDEITLMDEDDDLDDEDDDF